jgi:hypothetical protein
MHAAALDCNEDGCSPAMKEEKKKQFRVQYIQTWFGKLKMELFSNVFPEIVTCF